MSFITVPTWKAGVWSHIVFETRQDFIAFVLPLFKVPGEYNFDETSRLFNSEGQTWDKHKYYCLHQENSKDYRKYWDTEKDKCRNGVIFHGDNNTWYLPRDYYWFLNFIPLYNKVKRQFEIADIYDAQYHMALYELLADLHGKDIGVIKKRQFGSSYYHAGKLTNLLWFEQGVTLKMAASDKKYIFGEGTWSFLQIQRNHLNTYTAWYRGMSPGGEGKWIQQNIEYTPDGREILSGSLGKLTAYTCERNPLSPVGGNVTILYYEEAGITKTMDKTKEAMDAALGQGVFTKTGVFIAAGSVGELTECEPLKKMIYDPDAFGIYAIENNLVDEHGTIARTGLFIPEQWSMPPYIDKFGNSLVKEALAALDEYYEQIKREKDPGQYQFAISQRPRNLAEAFAYRGESEFPKHILSAQRRRIEEKEYAKEYCDIEIDETDGKPRFTKSSRNPISDFPISPKTVDKRGCVVVWERPVKNPPFGAYYASVDPVEKGKTRTSESLCSIYVHKTAFETRRLNGEGKLEVTSEEPGMVAAWCGRFDNPDDTHNYLQWIIEMYGAWTVVENNVSGFITHMIGKNLQKYLVPSNQMIFKADIRGNTDTSGYGWRNTGSIFRDNMLQYLKDHIRTITHQEFTSDGSKVVKTVLGVEEIKDIMLITEMEQYRAGINVDRLVSYTALRVLIALQEAHRGRVVVDKTKDKEIDMSKFAKLQTSPFRHMGGNNRSTKGTRNPFKHMR